MPRFRLGPLCATLLGSVLLGSALTADDSARPAPVRIGMCQSFFVDVPRPLISLITEPFGAAMRDMTGLEGQLVVAGDHLTTGKKLSDGELQLGVFHGFEFAWAQQKNPDLRPLMVAMNQQRQVYSYVLVRKDNEATSFVDLRGKELSVPRRTKEHCRLFVERNCTSDGTQCDPKAFFSQIVPTINLETALDELCLGKVNAVALDTLGLEFYKDLKPGCFARLRVLKQSEPFPPAVIAYKQGAVDDATLNKFRDGLVNANKSELGREMMKMWKVSAFEPVPDNYAQQLADVLKAYPATDAGAKVSQR